MNNDGQTQTILPPLPPSDEQSIAWNRSDGFYGLRSRDFWGKNQVVRETLQEYKKCNHYFIQTGRGAECKNCHIGYIGNFEIKKKGRLYIEGRLVDFNNKT